MSEMQRRDFLKASSAAAAGSMLTAATVGQAGEEDRPKLRGGVIGTGWYGMVDARAALKVGGVEFTAVCDVDSAHLEQAASELEELQGTRPRQFKLYNELLAHDPLDFVIIATPPQWHALQLLAALKGNKDVYCEKPLAYDLREARAMVDAVRQADRVVQIGFQRRQSKSLQEAGQFVKSGGIGQLVQVDAQIHYRAGLLDSNPVDPPATLDWDLWCGPGPRIPYSPQVGHKNWRLEHTSGHGHLVDWGIHLVDAIRMLLGLSMPTRVTAAGGLYQYAGRITTPDTLSVHFEFAEVPVHWRHRLWGATEYAPEFSNGIFFFGTEGTVFAGDRKWVALRPGKPDQPEEHGAAGDLGPLHMADFLNSVRTRGPVSCPIETAFQSTGTVQLAMISYETGTTVRWNEQTEQIEDNPAAAALLKREYRPPWRHPYTG